MDVLWHYIVKPFYKIDMRSLFKFSALIHLLLIISYIPLYYVGLKQTLLSIFFMSIAFLFTLLFVISSIGFIVTTVRNQSLRDEPVKYEGLVYPMTQFFSTGLQAFILFVWPILLTLFILSFVIRSKLDVGSYPSYVINISSISFILIITYILPALLVNFSYDGFSTSIFSIDRISREITDTKYFLTYVFTFFISIPFLVILSALSLLPVVNLMALLSYISWFFLCFSITINEKMDLDFTQEKFKEYKFI